MAKEVEKKPKDIWVVFTKNNARILVNPEKEPDGIAFKNPDLSRVQGVPPHLWKLVHSVDSDRLMVVPLSITEAEAREKDIKKNGIDNVIPLAIKRPGKIKSALIKLRRFFS